MSGFTTGRERKEYVKIFLSAPLGPLTLRNRLIHSATIECMATEDGFVTEPLIERYVDLAKGEVGLIIPGYLYVDPASIGNGARHI